MGSYIPKRFSFFNLWINNVFHLYRFELSNKQTQEETGEVREVPNEDNVPQKVVVVRGSYSYINPEGKTETITYYADESGFHPEGPSIPVVPEN